MGFKDLFRKKFNKSLFSDQEEKNPESRRFEPWISDLYSEVRQHHSYIYSNVTFGKCPTYEKIKSESDQFKIELIRYLPETIYKADKRHRNTTNTYSGDSQRELNYVRRGLLHALMRTKISFEEEDLKMLFNDFYDFKGQIHFNDWPIGFTATQVERLSKNKQLSDDFIDYLKSMLTWKEFEIRKRYWGSDIGKARTKLEEVIFTASGSEIASPPYQLSDEDKFGSFVNNITADTEKGKAQYYYQLFHHCLTATGGKPTKKYLIKSKEIVSEIGNTAFKSFAHQCFSFVGQLKAEEEQHTNTWQGREYTYSSWTFLEANNAILLKGLVWSAVQFHDTRTLGLIGDLTERCFKKIPGVGPAAAGVGNAGIYVLANTKGLEGVSHLSRLKLRVTQNNTKKLIQKYLDEASTKLGISAEEIEEISIPDFGLVEGKKEVAFEDYKLIVALAGVGKTKLSWVKPDGQPQKTVPAFVKQNNRLSDILKKTKEEVKKIQKYSTAQRDRIDRSFILDRKWSYESFEKYYLHHGLIAPIASKLIWTLSMNDTKTDVIRNEGQWLDINDNQMIPNENTTVALWHPIFANTGTVLQWREKLEALEWQQPIKQAYREIYILTDAEINTRTYSNRMAAHLLKQHQFNSLAGIRNWKYQLLGAYDDGRDYETASLSLPSWGLRAEYWINEVYVDDAFNDAGIWDYVATDQVKFVDNDGNTKELVDVPKIVLSEVLRDADLFVGVASVGNDPAWQDSGGERVTQYHDYWQSYSFGDLNEMAKTRKQVLEKLLPRLKIKNVATIDGKFLKIQGKLRRYKIHIGSTNILMEPNDQYLCIVPARGESSAQKNVFLPFEGDRGLSLVLSKAFLLADDDKITDSTIVSQIKRT